jgi:putative heme-binding domain-containing protein
LTNDKWSIPITIKYGPDGNVYMSDWYDKQICHLPQPEKWDRTNGRIFKISHKDAKPVAGVDLSRCSDMELVEYQKHENDWYARMARRLLQERFADGSRSGPMKGPVRQAAARLADEDSNPRNRLRGMWTLQVTGGLNTTWTATGLNDRSEHVRAWTVHFILEDEKETEAWFPKIIDLAGNDPSPVVRRAIASGLPRLPAAPRTTLLGALTKLGLYATDHNLPYLYWYALEPLCAEDPAKALKLAAEGKIPMVFQFAARRVGALGTPEALGLLAKSITEAKTDDQRLTYLRGLQEATRGKRQVAMPEGWDKAFEVLMKSPAAEVRDSALAVAVTFGDKSALATMRNVLGDAKAASGARLAAMKALVDARDSASPPLLQAALADKQLRAAAIRALGAFDDPKTPAAILAIYGELTSDEKRDAVSVLAARPGFAKQLMNAVAAKRVPASDISAETTRVLRSLGDPELDKQIAELWGVVRETAADRKKLIAEWKGKLTAPYRVAPDVNLGRAIFTKTCLNCHTLYAVGGKVGPEITGANRGNIDYLLENILDPSSVIPKDYAATRIVTTDERTLIGIVKGEENGVVTLLTERETLTIPAADVADRKPSELSMMPDDILKQVNEEEFRALIAYLQTQAQVPALATPDNAKDFFNGKDLNNWDGDKKLWTVENGEIVGKTTTGLKRNNFLVSHMAVQDFKLSVKVKLTPAKENSGIQFRSVPLEGGEMRGPQADIGQGWWGKLYEEEGRGLLAKEGGEKFVRAEDWNDYVVEAKGPNVKIWINGNLATDYTDEKLARRGVVGLQLHSGGPIEIRYKDVKLEVLR